MRPVISMLCVLCRNREANRKVRKQCKIMIPRPEAWWSAEHRACFNKLIRSTLNVFPSIQQNILAKHSNFIWYRWVMSGSHTRISSDPIDSLGRLISCLKSRLNLHFINLYLFLSFTFVLIYCRTYYCCHPQD